MHIMFACIFLIGFIVLIKYKFNNHEACEQCPNREDCDNMEAEGLPNICEQMAYFTNENNKSTEQN